jgi:Na+-driven multidrug efflux pump
MQLWGYVVMPALAVGGAASSMAAQNVGAGLWARVERTAQAGVLLNLALTGLLIALLYAVQDPLIALFLPGGPEALAVTRRVNELGLWGHMMLGVAFVLFAVVRATGAVLAPLAILAISLLAVRIPLALWLEPRIGAEAVWWTAPVSMGVAMLLAIAYYRFGGWRTARMLPAGGSRSGSASEGTQAPGSTSPPAVLAQPEPVPASAPGGG